MAWSNSSRHCSRSSSAAAPDRFAGVRLRDRLRTLLINPAGGWPPRSGIGTPDNVAAELERHRQTIRTTHIVLGMHLPGHDPAKTKASMELFAREVLPTLQ